MLLTREFEPIAQSSWCCRNEVGGRVCKSETSLNVNCKGLNAIIAGLCARGFCVNVHVNGDDLNFYFQKCLARPTPIHRFTPASLRTRGALERVNQ